MKEKIQEVQLYFINKIMKGQYKVKSIDKYGLKIIIDAKYVFELWHCTGESQFKVWHGDSFMNLNFNDATKKAGYKKAIVHVKQWQDTELREKEMKELSRLQSKYSETTKEPAQ